MVSYRDILVAVLGLTPQVITETLYYLTQVRQPAVWPCALHLLTTRAGAAQVDETLLAPGGGQLYTFCADYGLDLIPVEVYVFEYPAGVPLDDIRTGRESDAVADQTLAIVRQLTHDPHSRVFASLAGGRKTQSVLLGFALQLYGRPQDVLLHVLVEEDFQSHREFFYPTRASQWLRTPDGRLLDARAARIDVTEIPYLRLRDKLFALEVLT